RELAPEIVHTNGLKMHLLAVWARPPGTPLVWYVHDYVARRHLSASLMKRFAHSCSTVVAASQSVADDLRALGGELPPRRAVWNAVDLERFSPDGDQLDLDDRSGLSPAGREVVRVGLVATFARWKGHHAFLEAIALLPTSLNVRAYVIGGAVYDTEESQVSMAELRETSVRLGLAARVGFTGFIDDPAPAIRALDVVVHASTEPEPFGLVIAEGMACGRALVVSYGGGACELVRPGVDALACTPGDAAALARCIEQLVADPGLRQRLGHAARATAERQFGRARLVNELLDVYEDIAPGASGEPNNPLRVLHVHSGNLYGGVETFLTTLAHDTAIRPSMASSFALCFEGRFSDELRGYGHVPHMLGAVRASRPHTVWRARRALARLLAGRRFDVVVCHEAWSHAMFGPTIRSSGLPLVFWRHTAGNDRHWLERWARRLVPDLAVSNSRFTAESLSRLFPNAPIETVYCPLRLPSSSSHGPRQRHDIRRSLHTSHGDVVIVQVGRLEPLKGHRVAIEALATLRDLRGWTYWIVGGPQRASDERYLRELKEVVRRQGLGDRVRFAGERRDVPVLLEAGDIYCQPNVSPEAFGISLVEAQGAGLPIVTSALGGAREIVDEACGLLVAPHDIDGLAVALRRLVSDASLRARLGQAARARAGALCDRGRQMQRIHDVLSSVVRRPRQPSILQRARALESAQP
ncbi:MAG TPA: glycosyltransferase, partial [Vicinamibacterales bacterium]